MSLLGVINTELELNEKIEKFMTDEDRHEFQLKFLPSDEREILEFLNFDLPEIVIVNFTDSDINFSSISEKIKNDGWLHNFGIIGIFDKNREKEQSLLNNFPDINILTLIDLSKIATHLWKSINLININKQIIFQMDLSGKLFENAHGSFSIENDPLSASLHAGLAATTLFQRGFISPEMKVQLQVSLSELLLNSIEHGNCRISEEEKQSFLQTGGNMNDLISEKCRDPEVAARRVFMEWEIRSENTKFVITDEGMGFNVEKYKVKLKARDPIALSGRGIIMARGLAQRLYYNRKGNRVVMIIPHDASVARETPVGFSNEEVVHVHENDYIFSQGENSDFIYYISSGSYSVYSQENLVGKLTPADIFMGEMSFLLNNKRSASVKADREGKLVKISRKSFISVVKEYPHYGIFLSKLIARKLVRSNDRSIATAE